MIGIILYTLHLLFKTTCVNFFCNRSWLVWTTTKFHIFCTKSLKKCRINIQQKFPSNNFYLNKYKLLKIISINCSDCSEFSFSLRGPKFWNDVLDKKDKNIQSRSASQKNLNQNYFGLKWNSSTSMASSTSIFITEKLQNS